MDDTTSSLRDLAAKVQLACQRLGIEALQERLKALDTASLDPALWNDPVAAEKTMKERASVAERVEPWVALTKNLQDLTELDGIGDKSLSNDLKVQIGALEKQYLELSDQLKLNGPYDDFDALLSIYAGAGGTDAQDWTQMLSRMYCRWAEQNGYKIAVLDEAVGEEAGLKSITVLVSGSFAFGKLKGEHGVHRLVRLSPFNSDNLRQTSFAKVEVVPKIDRPERLVIDDKDIQIDVYRAGGRGGQSVNTTDSAVRITHTPTGITVSIQNERSQLQNKETALTILRSKLAALQLEQHKENLSELKGPNQSAQWGNQIRSYVLHPYTIVKDLRTKHQTSDAQTVLDGALNPFIEAYLDFNLA